MIFGLNKPLILGLAFAVSCGGAFYYGNSVGKTAVRLEWEQSKNDELLTKREEDKLLYDRITELNRLNTELTNKVTIKYVDRYNNVIETEYKNRDVIKEVFVGSPFMTKGWVYSHDMLVKNSPIDPTVAADNTPSQYTWSDGLNVIAQNYSIALRDKAQNAGLKEFYEKTRVNYGPADSGMPTQPTNEAGSSGTSSTTASSGN